MMKDRERVEIGGAGFALFFAYAACIWLCEAADLFCFLTGLPQVTLLSRILVAAVMVFGMLMMRGRVSVRRFERPDILFVLGSLIILGFCAYKGVIPDLSTDVTKYHVFVQEPGFQSMTKEPFFFVGDFQFYGFRWPDRLFYPFRWLLGYRMGTIFGGLINALMFAQVRSLLIALYGKQFEEIRARFRRIFRQPFFPGVLFSESLLAFLITMTFDVWLQSGGYMVDCIGIPLMLEALRILLIKKEQKLPGEMVWYAALCGCFFAMKMTHVVYIVPMIAAYLIKFRKNLTVRRFVAAFAAAIVPVSVYLLYAYADTGNPVFPYFNKIFQSPFFGVMDFKDTRWGPNGLTETLAWPFLSALKPEYRMSEISNPYNAGAVCMMAALLAETAMQYRKSREERRPELLFVIFACAWLWSASTGHVRYFVFGYMMIGVVFAGFLAENVSKKRLVRGCAAVCMLAVILVQPVQYMSTIAGGREWAWRNNLDGDFLRQNARQVFSDRKAADAGQGSEAVKAILMYGYKNGSIAHLLYPQAEIVHVQYLNNYISSEETREYWENRIDACLDDGGAYELVIPRVNGFEWEKYFSRLESLGLKVNDVVWPDTHFVRDHAIGLIGIEKQDEGEGNPLYTANEENNWLKVPNQRIHFKAGVTLNQTRGRHTNEDSTISLIARDAEQSKQLYAGPIREQMTISIDETFDLSGFGEDVRLELYWQDANGQLMDTRMYDCFMIDPEYDISA